MIRLRIAECGLRNETQKSGQLSAVSSVSQRTHEIGIRMALGAQSGGVLRLVLRQGMTLALIGISIGLAGAFASTQMIASQLFGVTTTDPVTFGCVPLLLGAVALLACYLPARRGPKSIPWWRCGMNDE